MKTFERSVWLTLVCLAALIGYGYAQNRAPAVPDPTHVSFMLAKDMKWEGTGGQQHVNLVGDPAIAEISDLRAARSRLLHAT